MDELRAIFASNLIKYRAAAGLTQAELGERIHYSDKSVSKWERAEAIPDAYVLTLLAKEFSVTVNDLLASDSVWTPPVDPESEPVGYSRFFVTLCTIAGIWTLCVLQFVFVWIFSGVQWVTLLAGAPLSLAVLLVFNSLWYNGRHNMYIIAGLVLCAVVLLFFWLWDWRLFLILIPAEVVVYFACQIPHGGKRGKRKKRKEAPESPENSGE